MTVKTLEENHKEIKRLGDLTLIATVVSLFLCTWAFILRNYDLLAGFSLIFAVFVSACFTCALKDSMYKNIKKIQEKIE